MFIRIRSYENILYYYHMMEVHVGENAATNRSLEKDFSAPSDRDTQLVGSKHTGHNQIGGNF